MFSRLHRERKRAFAFVLRYCKRAFCFAGRAVALALFPNTNNCAQAIAQNKRFCERSGAERAERTFAQAIAQNTLFCEPLAVNCADAPSTRGNEGAGASNSQGKEQGRARCARPLLTRGPRASAPRLAEEYARGSIRLRARASAGRGAGGAGRSARASMSPSNCALFARFSARAEHTDHECVRAQRKAKRKRKTALFLLFI